MKLLDYQVTVPFELSVVQRIARHKHGRPAMMLFHYLQVFSKLRRAQDGWVSVSQEATKGLDLDTMSRRRGLKALEELGIVELSQEERKAYRARLLYKCPRLPSAAGRTSRHRKQREQQIDADVAAADSNTAAILSAVT
jgi:hypothetical protein